jgi:hypothetical protein
MAEYNVKRGRGHPPWTEEQKQARREQNAQKRAERAQEELDAEQRYEQVKGHKRPKKYKRSDSTDPWTASMRRKNKATWDAKLAERDKEYKALIAANPHKTKQELGIPDHWKPRDGSSDGYYGVSLRNARVSINLPPINIKNPHEVEHRIDEYFDFCEINNKPPNMVGIAAWLGIGRKTLQQWKDGDYSEMTPIIQRAVMVIEQTLIEQVQDNPKASVGGMFLLKSMFHYKEQQDIVITTGAQKEELSADEIAKRYLEDGRTVETEFVEENNNGLCTKHNMV